MRSNREVAEKMNARANERKYSSFDEYLKYVARYTTGNAISCGWLVKQPCEVCGTDENVEAHHDDYMRPLDVRWLCKIHHAEHHRMND